VTSAVGWGGRRRRRSDRNTTRSMTVVYSLHAVHLVLLCHRVCGSVCGSPKWVMAVPEKNSALHG